MKLLTVSKPPGTHKTRTVMLSYLYDVVKPLKSIFFFFYLCVPEDSNPKNPHASTCQ